MFAIVKLYDMRAVALLTSLLLTLSTQCQGDLLPAYTREIQYQGGPDGIALFNGRPFTGLLVDEKTSARLGEFRDGKRQGLHIQLWPNGKKQSEGEYLNNRKVGMHRSWHPSGAERVAYKYNNGSVIDGQYTVYGTDGRKERVEHYRAGQMISTGVYRGDDLFEETTELHNDGHTIKSQGQLKNGEPEGTWHFWYPNGQMEKEVNYSQGKPTGLVKTWWPNGDRHREELYENGMLVRVVYSNDVDPIYSLWGMKKPGMHAFMATKSLGGDTIFILVDIQGQHRSGQTNPGHSGNLEANILGALSNRLVKLDGNMLMEFGRRKVSHQISISDLSTSATYDNGKTVVHGRLGTIESQGTPGYRATATAWMKIVELPGGREVLNTRITGATGIHPTQEQAKDASGIALRKEIISKSYAAFRILAPISQVLEVDKKGLPKILRVECGDEVHLDREFMFEAVRDEGAFFSTIATLEVREVGSGFSECLVKEGAAALKEQLDRGARLMAVSAYKL